MKMTIVLAVLLACAGCAGSKSAKTELLPAAVPMPPIVTREQWGSKPQPIDDSHKQVPKFITIHHGGILWKTGADPVQFVRTVQTWGQKEKNWPDLPYHFMIAPDGRIFQARPIEFEPETIRNIHCKATSALS